MPGRTLPVTRGLTNVIRLHVKRYEEHKSAALACVDVIVHPNNNMLDFDEMSKPAIFNFVK